MLKAGVEVIQDVGYEEVEAYARKLAKDRGLTYVSPYNDPMIVAGAGTTGTRRDPLSRSGRTRDAHLSLR